MTPALAPRPSLAPLPRVARWSLAGVALLGGCVGGPADAPPVDTGFDYFVPDHVLEVEITLDPARWDALREQERDFFEAFGSESCLDHPVPNPFTYFEGTVSVDGEVRERVGIRKKGFFGSLSTAKPALKIKIDAYVPGQDLLGTKRLTLNNARQDPSYLNQCLGYRLFARAGVPAPRCNFAHVTVNGEDLGLYVHVENVKKPFLRRHFDDDEGNLYEGSISDFREGWTGTFEQKTNHMMPSDRSDIQAVIDALVAGDETALGRAVDLDEFRTFWAMELLVGHQDGYASNRNNYFAYADPTDGRFRFMPWGIDNIFVDAAAPDPAEPAWTGGAIAYFLYTQDGGRDRHDARVRELLDTVWDEAQIQAEINEMEALIRPYLMPRDTGRRFDADLERLRGFVRDRRARLMSALDGPYDVPPQPDSFCFFPVGDVSGTFGASYTVPIGGNEPFAAGVRGTLEGNLDDAPVSTTAVGVQVGDAEGDPTKTGIGVFGLRPDGLVDVVLMQVTKELVRPGATVALGIADGFAMAGIYDPAHPDAEPRILGLIQGTVTFEEAGTTDGAAIAGRFDGQVLHTPFF